MDSNIDRISRGLASTTSRRQAFKMLGGGLLGGALAGAGFAVAKDAAAQRPPADGGTATLISEVGDVVGPLAGTLSNLVASVSGGALNIAGTFTDTAGNSTDFASQVLDTTGSCEILDLVLGPLDLNLLGVEVHLDTVHLNITAQSGPGNLLGNLLCAIAGLLDNGGPLQGLSGLLNNLFRALGLA
jgi:hypothetical protein